MKTSTLFCVAFACGTFACIPEMAATPSNEVPNTFFSIQQSKVKNLGRFVEQKYPGARILDQDHDDGFIEVKIRHEGIEKILIFTEGKRWIRTIWEVRRNRLPKNVISGVKRAGLAYENIDDNDNMIVDNPQGRFYAVQIDRDNYEPIFLMSRQGAIVRKINHDAWNDGRWIDDGEDRFDEGDDEWNHPNRHHPRGHDSDGEWDEEDGHWDDGEDRFDEGDDEWDDLHGERED